jgi:hypothetical protein
MLKAPPRLAQDLMENALPCQLGQSREAGSCSGANRPKANANSGRKGTGCFRALYGLELSFALEWRPGSYRPTLIIGRSITRSPERSAARRRRGAIPGPCRLGTAAKFAQMFKYTDDA